jgi:NADP-dependent 3-hydroxy acid dehydrogenase YdfG
VNTIIKDLWGIDILINNAGIRQKLSPLEAIDENTVQSIIQTNLIWLMQCTRLFLSSLKTREEGAIINISSKSWVTAQAWQSVYTASKYGVRWFTEVLKTDLKWTNIRVSWIYQSGTNTQMFNKTGEDFPIQNFTDPKDLADVISYMLTLPKKIWLHDVRVEY